MKTPEAERSVTFETPAEKPNLTLVTVFTEISQAKSVVFRVGAKFATWRFSPPQPNSPCPRP